MYRILSKQNQEKGYSFDQVFETASTQESIFRRTRADYLIRQVLMGFHATIFVYGQTGSGKTYTMEGYRYARANNNVLVPQINRKTASYQKGEAIPNDSPDVEGPQTSSSSNLKVSLEEEGIIPRTIRELFA